MCSVMNFEPRMNMLHCMLSVTYNFKTYFCLEQYIFYSTPFWHVMCDYPIITGEAIKHSLPSLCSWNELYLLFCKLYCFFTSCESGEGSWLRSWNCAANVVAYKREREEVSSTSYCCVIWLHCHENYTRTLSGSKPTQKLYLYIVQQSDMWNVEGL